MDDDEATSTKTVVHVTYHQLPFADEGVFPELTAAGGNGLLYTDDAGIVVLLTGIHTGVVSLELEARSSPPADVAVASWDEVVEASVEVPNGQMRVTSLMSEIPPGLPLLTPHGPGPYRVRAHARGRDTDIDGTAFEPFETYRVILWPAPPSPALIYKQTDRFGREWA